ncbi:MAG: arginine--tRNA ligase [Bacilli bacterium]
MITKPIEELFTKALNNLNYEIPVNIIKSNRPDLCDYQFDGVFRLAGTYHKNPEEIGKELISEITKDQEYLNYIEKIEFIKPGFINITLCNKYINECLVRMNESPKFGYEVTKDPETFVLDYGGYNIAKPLHIGHLRPSIIGESIKRIINYVGHKTIADVHLGDYGLQMGQVIYGIERDKKNIEDINLEYLNKIYPEISALCKENENIREECATITKILQEQTNEEYNRYWKKIMEVSLEDIKEICSYLDISFDLWEGESDNYKRIKEVENLLKDKNLLEESEGALVINVKKDTDNKPMPPMMFRKSNGAYSYDPTDLCAIYDRLERFNPDHIIYVTDFRQSLHFEQIFRASEIAGLIPYHKLEHAYNGTINGSDGKPFKTRSGGAPKLRELFALVKETFINLKEDNKNMSQEDIDRIVNGIIKYADLQNSRDKDYIFDVEKFSNVIGKTGPYIQYTYLRINKILKNEENTYTKLSENIYNKQDRDLRIQILNLDQAITNAFKSRMPNYIATYLYDICVLLNAFYQNNHISSEKNQETKEDWLYILNLGNKIIKEMLTLLMIDIPSVM